MSSLSTTRSGEYAAIASAFGVKADRSVTGASAGKSEVLSTASTWSPAPMAKSISVAEADIDTMVPGRWSRVSSPSSPVTVTGKAAPAEASVAGASRAGGSPPQAGRGRTRGSSRATGVSRRAEGVRENGGLPGRRHAPRTQVPGTRCATPAAGVGTRRGAGDLARVRDGPPQLRDSAGFPPDFAARAPPAPAGATTVPAG